MQVLFAQLFETLFDQFYGRFREKLGNALSLAAKEIAAAWIGGEQGDISPKQIRSFGGDKPLQVRLVLNGYP